MWARHGDGFGVLLACRMTGMQPCSTASSIRPLHPHPGKTPQKVVEASSKPAHRHGSVLQRVRCEQTRALVGLSPQSTQGLRRERQQPTVVRRAHVGDNHVALRSSRAATKEGKELLAQSERVVGKVTTTCQQRMVHAGSSFAREQGTRRYGGAA